MKGLWLKPYRSQLGLRGMNAPETSAGTTEGNATPFAAGVREERGGIRWLDRVRTEGQSDGDESFQYHRLLAGA